jgi:hypothetical protein
LLVSKLWPEDLFIERRKEARGQGTSGNGLKFVKRDLLKVKNAGLITGRNRVVGNHPREGLNSWHYHASTHLQRRPVIGATHQGEHRDSGSTLPSSTNCMIATPVKAFVQELIAKILLTK